MHVVLACRDVARGSDAIERIRAEVPRARLELGILDLEDLESVRAFAETYVDGHDALSVLVNNAGIMAVPHRATTAQGFELQFGTNHLGHFALTGRLLPALAAGAGSRVVTVSSVVHRRARIELDDLQSERRYSPWRAYGASKLANLLFALEFDRRLEGWGMRDPISVAAHPGFSTTNLLKRGPSLGRPSVRAWALRIVAPFTAQSARGGALPIVYAASEPDVEGGGYYGPAGPGELRGYPTRVAPATPALDEDTARRLWEISRNAHGRAVRTAARERKRTLNYSDLSLACTWSSRSTFLPTSMPPVSTAMFHVRSQFSRSTVVLASANNVGLSMTPGPQPRNSPFRVIGFVTSRTVRSPSSSKSLPPVNRTLVLLNVIFGNLSTSKKSLLRRWLSRISDPDWTLSVPISTSTLESSGVSPTSIVPATSVKRPRTFVSMCRATNSAVVCSGSISQVPAGAPRPR